MRLQPVGKAILVQLKPLEKKSILMLREASEEPYYAYVKGVGEKVEIPIKEDDLIFVGAYAGGEVPGGTKEEPYFLIAEKDVLGVMK